MILQLSEFEEIEDENIFSKNELDTEIVLENSVYIQIIKLLKKSNYNSNN